MFYGRLEAITDLITFEADSAKQLRQELEAAVDDYLETCQQVGKTPDNYQKVAFSNISDYF